MLIRDLSWLLALADHEHVTGAAAALRTSQPTLSRSLARVEAELGARLFERASDGIHPNPAGELVLAGARELVARYDQLLADLAGVLDPETGVVRLAFLDSMATSLVPGLLRSFHEHAPRMRVVLRQEPAHEIRADLETGAAELAITSERPPGGYGWHPLQEDRLVLVVPPTHPLSRRKRISLTELADEELVTTPVGFGYRSLIDGLLRDAGIAPRVSFESQDLATIEGLVAAGLGVALVPEQFAGVSGTVGVRLQEDAARRTIGLTWPTSRELPPPALRFCDFVVDGKWSGATSIPAVRRSTRTPS
ncbi:LysR family transcriptional regulator [Nocardioides szechwanensis]|uniref:LysR family transcriptional regulator n=1 Tax=Nocardioides szechwanensis TaxID=1005944 RepID=UPI000B881D7C|nr:LysR family transcriptional regulator [Nocardioides szechwanensis]GEP33251.1 LysR family transcriptional regulator [Nocardioides szechwanensis]